MVLDNIVLNKEQLQKSIESLPQTFTASDLLEQIFLEEDIKTALHQIDIGKVHTHDEVIQMIESWRR